MSGSVSMIDGHIDEVLKPCPFCGVKPKVAKWGNLFSVECRNDDCEVLPETAMFPTEAEAIEVWDRRADT